MSGRQVILWETVLLMISSKSWFYHRGKILRREETSLISGTSKRLENHCFQVGPFRVSGSRSAVMILMMVISFTNFTDEERAQIGSEERDLPVPPKHADGDECCKA